MKILDKHTQYLDAERRHYSEALCGSRGGG